MGADTFNDLRMSAVSARERIFTRERQAILSPPATPSNSFTGGLRAGKAPVPPPMELPTRQRPNSARQTALMTLRMPAHDWQQPSSPRDLLWTSTNGWTGWNGAGLSPWMPGGAPHPVSHSAQLWGANQQQIRFAQYRRLAQLQAAHRLPDALARTRAGLDSDSAKATREPWTPAKLPPTGDSGGVDFRLWSVEKLV